MNHRRAQLAALTAAIPLALSGCAGLVGVRDAPAEVTEGIAELARTLVAERYPETSQLDALLGLSWEWAHPLDSAEAAEKRGS